MIPYLSSATQASALKYYKFTAKEVSACLFSAGSSIDSYKHTDALTERSAFVLEHASYSKVISFLNASHNGVRYRETATIYGILISTYGKNVHTPGRSALQQVGLRLRSNKIRPEPTID